MAIRLGWWALCVWLVAGCDRCGSCGSNTQADDARAALALPDVFKGYETHLDLVKHAHLADVYHHGLFVDFGTPARDKYTVGQWRTGWVDDSRSGDATFSRVGETGRVFFPWHAVEDLTLRFRMYGVGTQAMTVFLNNTQVGVVHLNEGAQFHDYDLHVPSTAVKSGENYLLVRFGGSQRVDGKDISAAVQSLRVMSKGAPTTTAYRAPTFGTMVQTVAMDGVQRMSVANRAPTVVSYYLQVPTEGRLGFGVAVEGDSQVPVNIRIQAEGEPSHELFSGNAEARWTDRLLSLDRWEGKVVRLDLVAEGTSKGRVAWSALQLLTPEAKPVERATPKNLVVVLVDTLRADKLKAFDGSSRVKTPVINALAEKGVVFENAQSAENWTKPSVASVLTGLYPVTHGAKTDSAKLPESALVLSEHLRSQGFRTGSFIANGYVSNKFGFDQGWNHYTNYIRESKSTEAENVFREAGEWIEANRDKKFFAYVHTIDPHVPYDPPAEFLSMYDRRTDYDGQVSARKTPDLLSDAKRNPPRVTFTGSDVRRLKGLHDGEISYHDVYLGKFIQKLKALGVWEDTLFVFTSDHGEEFDDHGSWGHGHSVYQELLHVPLMFYGKGVPVRRVPNTVGTVDITSTVTELMGLLPMPGNEGRSLVPFMDGHPTPYPTVAFSDFLDDRRVIRAGRWKLVLRGINGTLFDLASDPGEQNPLDRNRVPIGMRYCRIMQGQFLGADNLTQWLHGTSQQSGASLERENAEMDETTKEQLRAIGYGN